MNATSYTLPLLFAGAFSATACGNGTLHGQGPDGSGGSGGSGGPAGRPIQGPAEGSELSAVCQGDRCDTVLLAHGGGPVAEDMRTAAIAGGFVYFADSQERPRLHRAPMSGGGEAEVLFEDEVIIEIAGDGATAFVMTEDSLLRVDGATKNFSKLASFPWASRPLPGGSGIALTDTSVLFGRRSPDNDLNYDLCSVPKDVGQDSTVLATFLPPGNFLRASNTYACWTGDHGDSELCHAIAGGSVPQYWTLAGSVYVADGYVYGIDGVGNLNRLELASGTVHTLMHNGAGTNGCVVGFGDSVYWVQGNETIWEYSRSTGQIVTLAKTQGGCPVAIDEHSLIIFLSTTGGLYKISR